MRPLIAFTVVALAASACNRANQPPPAAPLPAPEPEASTPAPPPEYTSAPAPASAPPGAATPLPPREASSEIEAVQRIASAEVSAGMTPDGPAFAGSFAANQELRQPITIQSGRCYTVVATSTGIEELDVRMLMNVPPLPPTVLAADATKGPTSVVGGRAEGCWKNPTPMSAQVTVVVRATRGAGVAAAQVFMR